jgi:hypothetical protein
VCWSAPQCGPSTSGKASWFDLTRVDACAPTDGWSSVKASSHASDRGTSTGQSALLASVRKCRLSDGYAVVWTSMDGITWARVDDAVLGAAEPTDVTVGGPGLAAVGNRSEAFVWVATPEDYQSRRPPVGLGRCGSSNALHIRGPQRYPSRSGTGEVVRSQRLGPRSIIALFGHARRGPGYGTTTSGDVRQNARVVGQDPRHRRRQGAIACRSSLAARWC